MLRKCGTTEKHLPDHGPFKAHSVERMPVTPNGKVDHVELLKARPGRASQAKGVPASELEKAPQDLERHHRHLCRRDWPG